MNPLLLTGLFDIGSKLITRFFPDEASQNAAKLELLKMQQSGELQMMANETSLALAQIEVNKTEAASPNMFVAGGRPFIMWICGFAFAYSTIIEPIARFVALVVYQYSGAFPLIDTALTLQVLFGILGLGAYRTFEKTKGVA